MKYIVFDAAMCNGCYNCQVACKDEHCGADWRPYAAPQPLTGQYWCRVYQRDRGKVPMVRVEYTPVMCGHCDDCPLPQMAPDCVTRRDDGLVLIDPDKAKGRRDLVDACPSKAIFWNEELEVAQKCTGCAHLIDDGWKEPRCVDACSTDALVVVDEGDPALEDTVDLFGNTSMNSHLRYKNLTHNWIAAMVVDPQAAEAVIGAKVTVLDDQGRLAASLKTDEFGEFHTVNILEGPHKVTIEASGYAPLTVDADTTASDVMLGEVHLTRFSSSLK